jgi:D-arabinose 1-dehydrogenase-like Zn-dependent alcohol dehydrogenase
MYAAGDVRIENVPDPRIEEPTDAVIRVTRACICGSDLWPYQSLQPSDGAHVASRWATRTDDSAFVCEDDGLDAVAEVELG